MSYKLYLQEIIEHEVELPFPPEEVIAWKYDGELLTVETAEDSFEEEYHPRDGGCPDFFKWVDENDEKVQLAGYRRVAW